METHVPRVLHVLFARLLACEINLCARVRVTCKYTCEDVNLLQVCTVRMSSYHMIESTYVLLDLVFP